MQSKGIKTLITIFILFFLLFPPIARAENDVVINEFIVHPTNNEEWIELYNPDEANLTEYWIDDDSNFSLPEVSAPKKSLSTLITDNSKYPYINLSSFLNNDKGEIIVIFGKDGKEIDKYSYEKDPGKDISIGRYPDGTGEFQILASTTKGQPNSDPQPTPTLTPTEEPTPTKIPTPTKEPTPTRTPTPTKTPTPTPTPKAPTPTKVPTPTKIPTPTKTPTSKPTSTPSAKSKSGLVFSKITGKLGPTSILGTSTNSAAVKPSPQKNNSKTLVQSSKDAKSPFLIIPIGVAVVFLSCAILIFVKIRKKEDTDNSA